MFQTIRNAWKIPDLRKKILFTLFMIAVFRLGSYIPVPGLDRGALQSMIGEGNNLFGMLDLFSGGAFGNATIFAMSITPYINSSIIIQDLLPGQDTARLFWRLSRQPVCILHSAAV